jgi:Spy/CpxP family protein refolding chaperone
MYRNIAFVALIVSIAIFQAGAQAAPPSHNILGDPNLFADAHLKGLDAQLHLSDEQKQKLRPVFYAEGQRLIAIMNDSSLPDDQKGQKIQQLHEQTEAKVASMLTPAQRKALAPPPTQKPATQKPSQT